VKTPMPRPTACSAAIALMLWCALGVPCGHTFTASPKLVEFEGAAQALDSPSQRLARERKEIAGDRLRGFLAKPEGDGPFPAIVALHGCSGLPEAVVQGASERAVSRGYVMLLVDSFTTRAIDHTCTADRYAAADIFKRTLDAYGALQFLARQPFVDAHRVAVVGASQGGMVTLSVAEVRSIELFVNPSNLSFRAAIALYPGCGVVGARPSIPTLILVGELDDWTPARDCERALAHWGNTGAPIQLITYQGAHHAFDVEMIQPGTMMFGHWTEYNGKAAEDARRRMYAFLADYLQK
jgi:dienelactone hydrolase